MTNNINEVITSVAIGDLRKLGVSDQVINDGALSAVINLYRTGRIQSVNEAAEIVAISMLFIGKEGLG